MTERLIDKLDRLGAVAEIGEMTPEIRRFAMLVRQDVVEGWPKREWVGLTDGEVAQLMFKCDVIVTGPTQFNFAKAIETKLKEKNEM